MLVTLSEKLYTYVCSIPNGFRNRDILLDNSKLLIRKRYYLLFLITGIYFSSDIFGTVYLVYYISENSTASIRAL
jgi:hypothetical protein